MPQLNCLFWNLNRQPLEQRIGRLVAAHQLDIVALTECPIPTTTLEVVLTAVGIGAFAEAEESGSRLRLFSRLPRGVLRFQFLDPSERWLLYRVALGHVPDFFLVLAHLPSKVNVGGSTQSLVVRSLAADIVQNEGHHGHQRTIVVGDLNMNPFEEGVAGADTLHGVMTRSVAEREVRTIQDREYRMFYNPMWGLLGDRTPGPPGTFYRSAADAVNYFWNTYDQVLVRPDMIDRLSEIRVLDSDGSSSLLTPNGLPDKTSGSDHLPLFFRLEW